MRGLVVFLIAAFVYGATIKRECSVSDFVELGYSSHDPKERAERAWAWLEESGPHCTKEQLALIYNNLATVLGAVDSVKIRSKIEKLYERAK